MIYKTFWYIRRFDNLSRVISKEQFRVDEEGTYRENLGIIIVKREHNVVFAHWCVLLKTEIYILPWLLIRPSWHTSDPWSVLDEWVSERPHRTGCMTHVIRPHPTLWKLATTDLNQTEPTSTPVSGLAKVDLAKATKSHSLWNSSPATVSQLGPIGHPSLWTK